MTSYNSTSKPWELNRLSLESLGFGLTLTALGVVSVFSALAVIAITSEILKRRFKVAEFETASSESPLEEPRIKESSLIKEKLSAEEEAAMAAAIAAYVRETPRVSGLITAPKRGAQPTIWSITGRMELMELRVRRRQ